MLETVQAERRADAVLTQIVAVDASQTIDTLNGDAIGIEDVGCFIFVDLTATLHKLVAVETASA
jgi:hypothetical protein